MTGPDKDSTSSAWQIAPTASSREIQLHHCRPLPTRPPNPSLNGRSQLPQGRRRRVEQGLVALAGMGERERPEFLGQGERDQEVGARQELVELPSEPLGMAMGEPVGAEHLERLQRQGDEPVLVPLAAADVHQPTPIPVGANANRRPAVVDADASLPVS